MIRVLVMIAVAGFVLSVVTLSAAVAIGGPEVLSHAAWTWGANRNWNFDKHWQGSNHWSWDDDESGDVDGGNVGDSREQVRKMVWTGGDTLDIEVPAEVRYTQAAGPATLTITGPRRLVDDIEIENGHVRFDHGSHSHRGKLTIVMTAPNINRFDLHGSSSLEIENYRQDQLTIDLSGNADVTATGEANVLTLDISGSAAADLGQVKAKGARVDISGSGEATIAPTDWAKVDIAGSGDVTLLTNPPKLDTDVSGSGSVHREHGEASPAPAPAKSGPAKNGKAL